MPSRQPEKRPYTEYDASEKVKKKRAARNKARRRLIREGKTSKGDGKDVDHIDGNPHNNSPSNLRVVSQAHNRSRNNNR